MQEHLTVDVESNWGGGLEKEQKLVFIMYLLTLIERTVAFDRNSFAGDLGMVLRIENLIMNYPYPWKWSL